MQHNIVYLSHGSTKFHDQTRFSVLTLLDLLLKQNRNDIRILVFTDALKETPAHDLIHSSEIAPKDIALFRGPLDYVHRIRLEVLRRLEATMGAPFIYVDCDTRWIKIPDEQLNLLADGGQPLQSNRPAFFMHKNEGAISDSFFPEYVRLLHQKKSGLIDRGLQSTPPFTMWNAGTLGVPSKAVGFFDEVLAITDDLLPYVKCRNFLDQLMLSLVATTRFDVQPFDDCLAHYWGYSHELPVLLRQFFSSLPSDLPVEKLATLCGLFYIDEPKMQQMHRAPQNRFNRWRTKMVNSFHKRKLDLKAWQLRMQRPA